MNGEGTKVLATEDGNSQEGYLSLQAYCVTQPLT